ncbi:hypothetical protein O3G_MSEX005885 [Manduca sexta]|uniref:Uncharacterized protein n=1 Tax=Manduca sexta TaxID=7130 RepID=A0A922CK46_MANSE|nr:hypothetical protein O3G_MSEX005885 [Manduca sexta]
MLRGLYRINCELEEVTLKNHLLRLKEYKIKGNVFRDQCLRVANKLQMKVELGGVRFTPHDINTSTATTDTNVSNTIELVNKVPLKMTHYIAVALNTLVVKQWMYNGK